MKQFRKDAKKSGKVILLLDNVSSHSDVELLNVIDEDFQVKYLPPMLLL